MTEIETITVSDNERFLDCIFTAFSADPTVRYIWPEPSRFIKYFKSFSRIYCGSAVKNGTAWSMNNFNAVAGWLAPGEEQDEDALIENVVDTCLPERIDETLEMFEKLGDYHPEEPCWYLPMIGVDPCAQGHGLGGKLMEHALARVDSEGKAAFLESSNPRNVSLYQRYGFQVMDVLELGGNPIMTPMYRPAAA